MGAEGATLDRTWLWPVESWTQEFWRYPVVSRALVANPLSPVGCEVGSPWTVLVPAHPADAWLDLGDLEATSKPCFVAVYIVSYSHWGVLLPGGGERCLQQCLGGWCMLSGITMNARTQGSPAGHCMVTRWSMLPLQLFVLLTLWLIGIPYWLFLQGLGHRWSSMADSHLFNATFSWETLAPEIHVKATWHALPTKVPMSST